MTEDRLDLIPAMQTSLASLENKLLLPEGEEIAIVHPSIARAVTNSLTRHEPGIVASSYLRPRIGQMFFGRYGALGYVELNLWGGAKQDVGDVLSCLVDVPIRLLPLVEALSSPEAYKGFESTFFSKSCFGEGVRQREEELNPSSIAGITFFTNRYYFMSWKPLQGDGRAYELIEERDLNVLTSVCETEVKHYLRRLDAFLDGINPLNSCRTPNNEEIKEHYARLENGRQRLLGQA